MRAPVSILEGMVEPIDGKPVFWVTSNLDIGAKGEQCQIILEPSDKFKYEPIPGLTAHVAEMCHAGAFKAILGATSTPEQRTLYLSVQPLTGTHTEVDQ